MNKLIFMFLIILSLQLPSQKGLSQSNWFWQNPLPQGNDLYAVQFLDEYTGYASGYGFAILKTTSAGMNWFNVARIDSIPSGNNPGYFSNLVFFNSETGFVGGNGLYKTTNGGISWDYINSLISINSFSFPDQNTGYIINDNSLVKSTDGGYNWFSIPFDPLNSRLEKITFTSRDTGFIISRQSSNPIFKTINGGVNWTVSFSSGDAHKGIYFCDNNTGFVAGDREILKTTNGGNNWTYLFHSIFSYFTNIYFVNPNTGYVTNYLFRLQKTTNSGVTWDTLLKGLQYNGFSFLNEQTGYVACEGSHILKTTNSGNNWNNTVYNVTTESLNKVFFINENTGYIAGNNNVILKTTNAGMQWINSPTNFPDNYLYIKFFNENSGILQGSNILTTNNGGITWDSVAHFESINVFDAVNQDTFYFRKQGSIYKSFDGGNTWTSRFVHEKLTGFYFYKNNDIGFCFLSFEQQCAHCPPGFTDILKTTNNGLSWILTSSIFGASYQDIVFTSDQTGFISGHSGLRKTVNAGISWSSNIHSGMLNPLYVYNSNILYCDQLYNQIYKSTNGGNTWERTLNSTGFLNSVFFTQTNTGYVVGDYGKILKTTNGGGIFVGVSNFNQNQPDKFTLFQNYPNPFNPITKISFDLSNNAKVKLVVYDLLGREVRSLVNEKLSPGKYTYNFDGSDLPSGVYFYRIEAGDFRQVKRMVLIK